MIYLICMFTILITIAIAYAQLTRFEPEARMGSATAAIGNKAYTFAGYNKGYLKSAEYFDLDSGARGSIAPFPLALEELSAVAFEDNIYIFGGVGTIGYSDQVFVYHPSSDTYTRRAPLQLSAKDIQSCYWKGFIYLAGGENYGKFLNSFYLYNPQSDHYFLESPLPEARKDGKLVGLKEYIYYIAGEAQNEMSDDIFRYDGKSWEKYGKLPKPLSGFEAVAYQDKILIMGGMVENDYTFNSTVWEYDPETQSFREYQKAPIIGGEMGSAIYGSNLFLIDGYDTSGPINRILKMPLSVDTSSL